jgi:hypothetical protein
VVHMFEVTHCQRCGDDAQTDLTLQLITTFLMAAISGPDANKYVMAIQELEDTETTELGNLMQQVSFGR